MELESLPGKIIPAVISAFIIGTATYIAQYNKYEPQLERLARTNGKLESTVSSTMSQISTLLKNVEIMSKKYKELEDDYTILLNKYNQAISSNGIVYKIGSFDFNNYQTIKLRTSDQLEFRVVSGSVNIEILRISDRGPIVKISGLDHFLTDNEIESPADGENCFLLPLDNSFIVKYSSSSRDRGNRYILNEKLETIILQTESYNLDDHIAQIKYMRKIEGDMK